MVVTSGANARDSLRAFLARIFADTGINAGKNLLKRALGRKPYIRDVDRFVARHFFHLLSARGFARLTVGDFHPREGAGSRVLMTMYAVAFCRRYGLEYRHTPLFDLGHAVGDQREWDARWEAFFNLGEGELPASDLPAETFDLFELMAMKTASGGSLLQFIQPPLPEEPALYYTHIRSITDSARRAAQRQMFTKLLGAQMPEFRARYHRRRQPGPAATPFTVAVHIRRGDVGPERADMWTRMDSFVRTLSAITRQLEQRGGEFRLLVFSQGDASDFDALRQFSPDLRLDSDPFEAMEQMISADVLVMSKSCFSYVAALLGEGVAIFEDCDFPACEGWLLRSEDGALDEAALSARLDARLSLPR